MKNLFTFLALGLLVAGVSGCEPKEPGTKFEPILLDPRFDNLPLGNQISAIGTDGKSFSYNLPTPTLYYQGQGYEGDTSIPVHNFDLRFENVLGPNSFDINIELFCETDTFAPAIFDFTGSIPNPDYVDETETPDDFASIIDRDGIEANRFYCAGFTMGETEDADILFQYAQGEDNSHYRRVGMLGVDDKGDLVKIHYFGRINTTDNTQN